MILLEASGAAGAENKTGHPRHLTGNHLVAYRRQVDEVFKALADPTRRELLDRLRADNGQTLTELGWHLSMTRQAVTKHLAILEAANLVTTRRQGREKLHYLNPTPIGEIYDRWIGKYEKTRIAALADLKRALEDDDSGG